MEKILIHNRQTYQGQMSKIPMQTSTRTARLYESTPPPRPKAIKMTDNPKLNLFKKKI